MAAAPSGLLAPPQRGNLEPFGVGRDPQTHQSQRSPLRDGRRPGSCATFSNPPSELVWDTDMLGRARSHTNVTSTSFSSFLYEQQDRMQGAVCKSGTFSFRPANNRDLELLNDSYYMNEKAGTEPPYVVAFVNSRSGNTAISRAIKQQLETLLARPYRDSTGCEAKFRGEIVELSGGPPRLAIKKIKTAHRGRKLRFLVCGGDGTVTWLLQEIEECKLENPDLFQADEIDPPIGIVPAGTGNDLARSLGWGPTLNCVGDLVGYVRWTLEGCNVRMDQWKVTLETMSYPDNLPPAFRHVSSIRPHRFEGYFQNYFTIGMDAAVTYGVERSRRCWLGRMCFRCGFGKLCYALQGYRTGVFKCCCCKRSLSIENNSVRVPNGGSINLAGGNRRRVIRQFMLLNINSYAAGRTVFSDDDIKKVDPSDRKIELTLIERTFKFVGLVMCNCSSSSIIDQVGALSMTLEDGEYLQMDGEAWYMAEGCKITVEHNRQVQMLRPPTCPPGIWTGRQAAGFWGPAATV